MDVRLFAFLARQRSASIQPRERFCGLPKRGLAFILANAIFWQPLWAQAGEGIVVSAPGTSLDRAGNGVPIVNIAAPNGSGLSHNRFSDYNVGKQGVILNNATGRTQATQLGGIVLGNPNLKGSAATTILNEVNGTNPSQLRGYTEVAGQRAHVIVANPHGITCDGCGFINTPRATLSTGRPVIENGQLTRHQVDQGQVIIEGAGLNATNVDSFEIITRSAKINAQIQARDLTIVAGRNDVDARTLAATARTDNGSAKPELAIDSSALGGMYAGSIKLVGTEAGVGVKLDGKLIASGGDIQLDANGQLRMAQVSGAGDLRAKAQQVTVDGPVYAAGTAELSARGQLSNNQSVAAGRHVQLSGAQLINSGIVEAGVNADNSRNTQGDVTLTAQDLRNSASVVASRNLQVKAGTLDNQGGTLKGADAQLTARTLDNRKGRLVADAQLGISATRLDNREGKAIANRVNVAGGEVINQLGLFSAEQSLTFELERLDNSGKGNLVSNGTLQARVKQTLDNQADGLLSAKGTLEVQGPSLDNRGGLMVGDAGVSISGTHLNNSALGVISSLGDVQLDLGALNNSQGGSLASDGNLTLALGATDNRDGRLIAQGRLTGTSGNLDNRDGVISAGQGLDLTTGNVLNGSNASGTSGGLITSQGALTLRAGQFESLGGGEVSAKQNLQLTVARLVQQQARLIGEGNVLIELGTGAQPGDFDNRASLLSAGGLLQIKGLGNFDNRGGEVSSKQSFDLVARGTLDNGDQGRIISAGPLGLQAATLRNANQGLMSGWRGLTVEGVSLDNSAGGTLSSREGALGLTLSGALDNHGKGALVSRGDITLDAASLNNTSGILSTQGNLGLKLAGNLDNRSGGLLSAHGTLVGSGKAWDNRGGQITANGVKLDTASLDNSGGRLVSDGDLRLGLLGALLNIGAGSTLASAGPLDLTAGSVDNRGGQLVSQGLLHILAGRFDNSATGTVASQDALDLTLTEALVNRQGGLIYSKAGTLEIAASDLDNVDGTLRGQLDTTLRIQEVANNQGGHITSQAGNLDLQSTRLDNGSGGVLSSAGWLKLVTDWFGNNAGTTQAQSLDVQATTAIDNRKGHLSAIDGESRIVTGELDNRGGGLYASELLHVRADQLLNQGSSAGLGGKVGAASIDFSLQGALSNQYGLIESSGPVTLSAASIDNTSGAIRALGQTGTTLLAASGLLNNRLGRIETAAQNLDLRAGTLQNTAGTVLHVGTGNFGINLAQAGLAGGSFTTNGDLSYQASAWTNNAIIQARNLNLTIGQLNQGANGQLLAVQRLTGSGGNWSNSGLIASDGSLDLTLTGNYGSRARLSSVGNLTLRTGSITLGQAGSIVGGGTTSVTSTGLVENRGRLTSTQDLRVSAATLNNYGTLGSADDLHLTAATLLNENGLIFSGGDMQLRVGNFTNRYADVYSLGSLHIAADDQQGWASSIQNVSGSFESAGAMTLLVQDFDNRRDDDFQIGQQLVAGNIRMFADDVCDGKGCEFKFQSWERYEDVVTHDSPQASITAGGDFRFRGGAFDNLYSSIASGGNIDIQAATFRNQGAAGGVEKHLDGSFYTRTDSYYWTFRANKDLYNRYNDPASPDYNPGALTRQQVFESGGYPAHNFHGLATAEVQVSGTPVANAVLQAAGNVNINASDQFDNSVVRRNAGSQTISKRNVNTANGATTGQFAVTSQLPPDLVQRQVNPISLPSFTLPQGENGLFRLSGQSGAGGSAQGTGGLIVAGQSANAVSGSTLSVPRVQGVPNTAAPDNSHKYLIETNPELTKLKRFLGSDYLLDRVGYDPDKAQKRLGDGLYEQRLIQQAVVARTGQRYIDGIANDEALFKYLMDNAIAYKDSVQLKVGVGLTAEQVAALTHDIVWLEEAVVNGEKVLVPVLYLAQADGRLAPNGALIMGNDVALISGGDLSNQGTLRASGNLSATATNLDNTGLIEASKRLDLLAMDSIRNAAGGIISGGDVNLSALTGDVINERTITSVDTRSVNDRIHKEIANNAARIESRGELGIIAGRDLVSTGSVIQAGGDAALQAGRDLSIVSAQEVDSADFKSRRVTGNISEVTQHGSDVRVGGDLQVNAGRDVNVVASRVEAGRDLAVRAGRDVLISAAANETHSNSDYKGGGKEIQRQDDMVRQQSAELKAGGDVLVDAGENITLVSSKIGAGDEAYLVAGDKIELLAANDSDYSLYDMKEKGNWGQSKTQRDEVTDIKAVGSEISAGADITLRSGGDQKYQGAKLDSGNDIAIVSGGSVTFEAVKDLHQESHEKSKGDLAWQSSKGKGQTDETLRQTQLIAQGNVAIKAVEGLKIDIKHIDQQSVSQAIDAMVKADPNLAWLKEAETRGDVDWRQVREIHDSWKYSNSGMGPATQIAIAIAAAAIGGLAAAGALGSAGVGTATVTFGAGVGAAGSLSSTAAVSLINNKGDLGKVLQDSFSSDSLKQIAIASIVGGLSAGYFDKLTGTETQSVTGKVVAPLNTVEGISRFAANQALQNITSTALSQALGQGGSFGSALKDSLYNTLAAAAFNAVGNLHLENGSAQKIAAHALVGGLVAEAAGKDFASGAIAAGANEALATELRQAVTRLSPKNRDALLVMSSQLVGLVAAGLVKPDGKGMETGAWIAKNATQYNFLNHERAEDLVEDIHSCKGKPSCERDMWIGSGYNKESLENLDDALKTMGPVRAKDLMTQIQGGLAALGTLQCTTPTCENIKFELLDRSFKALDSLDEVYGFGAIVIGGIAGMAGAGGSRPGAGAVPGASSNVNKAYEYWAAVKAERAAGAKATASSPLKLGETKVINDVNMTRVGRWMSPDELAQMQSTSKVVQGGGGQTFISTNGVSDFKGPAPKGSVYVEFDVPANSLLQGGKEGWFKMIGPDASKSQQFLLNKQGGEHLPVVKNIEILDRK
ncbi:two-partner secretion domain-containing protein [Pseudomonas sp. ESBL1]|uniref:two-partner secretion domain-containing protein n=1 Tax=Pseudomonas sp. ESBL1 TaxID=3077324 RepID=UPI002FC6D129